MIPGIPDQKFQVEVDPTEDTEWNDILREKGIIPQKEPDPSEQLEQALTDAIERQHEHRLEGLDLDELEALEDDEDEEFLQSYKQQRIAEMKKIASKEKFGSVYPISKPEWQTEVTDASKESMVVVHLMSENQVQSRLFGVILRLAASKFKDIKFCEIEGRRAIENYPDANCPTILIYKDGELLKQYVTLLMLNGNDTSLKDLETLLVRLGCIDCKDKRLIINQQDDGDNDGFVQPQKVRYQNKSLYISSSKESSDDDDFFD
ncbi:hypothetical protein CANINC_001694 [Pichia inconspicua]|uniref:Phosducin domain-containing protein n=1 Tax=Pichia inconspicua TaxID=52247 RepID=A0A4T0X366_9ASCO|nr:hypothetical protein CANINC_001694 [[Candida] inconspicua]